MIVLTGGAGFIGSNILKALNQNGITDVLVVDNLNHPSKNENLEKLKYKNFCDKKLFLTNLESFINVEAIIHQGACSSTTETDEIYLEQNNVAYSKTLLNYSIKKNIPFIYASSAAIYGDGKLGFDDSNNDYFPVNGYANSKLAFDKYVTNLLETQKPKNKVIGLRYFNVYGFGEAHKENMSSVIYKFYQSYTIDKTIILFDSSDKILRDFIHIDDVVEINLFCLEKEVENGIYNVGTGKANSFKDLAIAFQNKFSDANIKYVPFPRHLQNKYQYFTEAKMDKLLNQGYSQQFQSIQNGVNTYLNKMKGNG